MSLRMDTSAIRATDPSEIFQETFALFHSSLPDQERQNFEVYEKVESMTVAIRQQIESINDSVQRHRLDTCLTWCRNRDEIGRFLKVYEKYGSHFQERAGSEGEIPSRLRQTLADVYVDIISFCHRVLKLFSSNTRVGLRLKLRMVGRQAWKPFDVEFEDVKSRLDRHRRLFEFEATSATNHEALEFFKKFDHDLEKAPNTRQLQLREVQLMAYTSIDESVEKLAQWISPPQWKARYEETKDARDPDTYAWILEEPIYVSWRSGEDEDYPFLFLHAKPGFGKSTLCPVVIDDLEGCHKGSPEERFSAVAYYFFDKQTDQQRIDLALRSFLAQILHRYRYDTKAIDIASALFQKKVAGQPVATDQEVFATLQLLLAQFPGAVLIVDAVDECLNSEVFLNSMNTLTLKGRHCFLVLFSRPTLHFPRLMRENCRMLHLQEGNTLDLEKFLRPRIDSLVLGELIPPPDGPDDYIEEILFRANNLFLWAKLLLRLDALENLNRLKGLDNIYREISDTLTTGDSINATANVKAAFMWLLGARRPVTVAELEVAMAQPLDGPLTARDVFCDFEGSIGHIFGGLLEVTGGRIVRFIHISANEFFTQEFPASSSLLNFGSAEIQLNIAGKVLSYLVNTVPARPLSGDESESADSVVACEKYPLLDYAVLFWFSHIRDAIIQATSAGDKSGFRVAGQKLVNLFMNFLYSRDELTVWLEASWLFGRPPSVCPLPEDSLLAMSQDGIGIQQAVNDYLLFCNDLQEMTDSWGYILQNEPHEVWGENIPIFNQSKFWLRTRYSQLICLVTPELNYDKSIFLASHISADGAKSAALRLILPVSMTTGTSSQNFPIDIFNWTVNYNIWSLESGKHLLTIAWAVDPEALKAVIQFATNGQPTMRANTRFMFPGSLESNPRAYQNNIDVFNQIRPHRSNILDNTLQLKIWRMSSTSLVVVFRQASSVFTSQSGELVYEGLLQFFRSNSSGDASLSGQDYVCFASWIIDIPSFYLTKFLKEGLVFHPYRPIVAMQAFTPFERRVHGELPKNPQTYLWDFGSALKTEIPRRPSLRDLHCPISDLVESMAFSTDGQVFFGKNRGRGYPIAMDIDECMSPQTAVASQRRLQRGSPEPWALVTSDGNRLKVNQNVENSALMLKSLSLAPTQPVGALSISHNTQGQTELSQLQQWEEKGALVLKTLSTDGKLQAQTLSRLPDSLRSTSTATILRAQPDENTDLIRIVLDKTEQKLYSLNDISHLQLPAIVERSCSAIRTATYTARPMLEDFES
ncbi:hypothetical protein BDW42DRAFT_188230 [Aspergillus taichungensis]|uniref:Nephrocystin 3-like N-terminal domain-containing protein n=1 Tax=Aspergillus taichungensis TaxID=482145 RepID=A0A2J5HJD0_9EURO|nr:hypothetical protein BDW42DRAFT_188230 [Aspergillus taichungensis]